MMAAFWHRWANKLAAVRHAQDATETDQIALSVTLEELLALRYAAADPWLHQLALASRPQAQGTHYPLPGRGLDFKEHRPYHAGDDLRHLDWKVTARRGQPYTRLYHQERQTPWVLVLDQSSAMQFGQRGNKAVIAARLAAQMGWAILAQQDQLALWIETDQQGYWQAQHHQRRHWMHTLAFIAQHQQQMGPLQPRPPQQWDQLLTQLRPRLPRHTQLVLISDFQGCESWSALQDLAQHTHLWLIHLTDPLDIDLAQEGAWVSTDEQEQPLTPSLRQAWQQAFIQRQQALQQLVQGRGRYLACSTASQDGMQRKIEQNAT